MGVSLKKHFWKWFQQNSEIFRCFNNIDKNEVNYWMEEIYVHLRAYCKNVYPCIWLPDDGTMAKLIISAGGNYKYFKRVEELVSKAPQIPGWEIVAFDPPRPIDDGIEEQYGHTGIDPHNLWFIPILSDDDEPPGIVVFAEEYKTEDPAFEAAVEAVIANLLGERSANLDIAGVTVQSMDIFSAEDRSEMMKLQELPAYLERTKLSSIMISEQGKMEMKSGMPKK